MTSLALRSCLNPRMALSLDLRWLWSATGTVAALARLRERAVGLVLLDLMMPEMDGFEFVAELRRNEAWRRVPVVVVTAKDLSREDHDRLNGYVQKILQKGAHGRDELLSEVRELVAASVARRRPRA